MDGGGVGGNGGGRVSRAPGLTRRVPLLGRTAIAGKWGDKGYWSKRFGVSVSKGTSEAFKYKALFELQFQVGRALGVLLLSLIHI